MISKNFRSEHGNHEKKDNYKYRSFLSQFLAATAKSLLSTDNGLIMAIPTIIIPALTGIYNEHNKNEFITITSVQASWLGGLQFIFKLIGSLISGIITDSWGRKKVMIYMNISYAIGWFILYQAITDWQVFLGIAVLGLSVGLTESAVVVFLGEICEPSFRGVFFGYNGCLYMIGSLLAYFLNLLLAWRTVCLFCFMVPIISAISMYFIPESPQWLLSKNRTDEAEKSLCWLRGWVPSEIIAQELHELKRHSRLSKSCNICIKTDQECAHPLPTLSEKITEFKGKKALKPILILISINFFSLYTGVIVLKPYMVQILKAYDSPIPADQAVTIISVLENFGSLFYICLVSCTGKRPLYLCCAAMALVCHTTLTWFGFTYLPAGYISFDQAHRETFEMENRTFGYIPLVCFIICVFCGGCCLNSFPWILLSELLPFKIRGIGCGILGSIFYVMMFIGMKTYYNLETTLSIPGVSLVFTIITIFALIFMYHILPETENRSLEDIELHFSDNSKVITDWKIAISKKKVKIEDF